MTRFTGNILALLAFIALGALYGGAALANEDRGQTWEIWAETRFLSGKTVDFDHGSSIKTDDDVGFGLGFGYNISEHWLVGFDFSYNEMSYNATIASANTPPLAAAAVSGSAQLSRFGGSVTYNILERAITPYVSANLGYVYADTNIPNGPPQSGCWWDPWYGYICSTWQSTFGSHAVEYGVGAGVRWDSQHSFFVRFGYEQDWINFSNANGTPAFGLIRLQFGTRL
jgi:opacity protein-like surface antigen